jgi:glycosyltransferase involved in cell wall biosynthesis
MTLSACISVADEPQYLEKCIASVIDVCDEVCVFDNGKEVSLDIEKWKSGKLRYNRQQWQGKVDYARIKNTCMDMATGDWILIIDADERLCNGRLLRDNMDCTRRLIGGFGVKMLSPHNLIGRDRSVDQVYPTRIIRNDKRLRFSGSFHENIDRVIANSGFVVDILPWDIAHIVHLGYDIPLFKIKKKAERNMVAIIQQLKEEPNNASHWSYLAETLGVLGERRGQIEAYEKAVMTGGLGDKTNKVMDKIKFLKKNIRGDYGESRSID